ncbi:hypothetical protein HPP92_009030 [Vanilla planifolia]|uniref:Uncharacterized protein n=1 Tax=Vanilla planifolia TaxID=51239 RepID=A0A835R982_VANPL|nr:hypothetical protein HPP92_009030 [Vanilla planifolia]
MEWRRGEIAASLLLICSLNPMSLSAQVTSKLPSEEIEALKRIAAAINKTNWDFNVDPCSQEASWVTHNAANGFENSVWCNNCTADGSICHVTSIVLKAQNLVGTLPPKWPRLLSLQEIDIQASGLEGPIPVCALSQLANLNDLMTKCFVDMVCHLNVAGGSSDVVGNSDFPTLARMEQLQFLTLRNCGITGSNP